MNNRPSLFSFFPLLAVASLILTRGASASTDDSPGTSSSAAAPALSPSAASSGPASDGTSAPAPTARPTTYTVVSNETIGDVSREFHTSVAKLKKLNHLKSSHLKLGQVLKIPPALNAKAVAKAPSASPSHKPKTSTSLARHRAEPVQDFDLANARSAPQAPNASTTAPAYSRNQSSTVQRGPVVAAFQFAPNQSRYFTKSTAPALPGSSDLAPAPKPASHGFFNFFYTAPPTVDWSSRFTQNARDLGDRGLSYDADWRPPGEAHDWPMDCSNTARYLYRITTGIQLPRTASDQYYYLHLQNKAWDVPQLANGYADCNYLRRNLKAGDLLFWENTYKPDRQPPITHVMIFLGTNARGEWTMAGSQSSRGGEHNRRRGGPDIYVFDPTRPCGGYTTWLGFVHHKGRFCAYGRPLEADAAKLAVANND